MGGMPAWTVAEAKARLSALIDEARQSGPQLITRHGKDAVVIVNAEDWATHNRKGSLAEFFTDSPLSSTDFEVTRLKDAARAIDL